MKGNLILVLTFLFARCGFSQEVVQSQFANIDDVKIHYKVYGKGDALILLHGSLECMEDWNKQIPDFSKQFMVVTMDNRGHGMSTFTDKKMDYALLSEDVVALMKQLNIDSAHIVGFGDGGIIGLYLSINHPDKVRKLVAIGANYKVDTTAVYKEILKKVSDWDEKKMYEFVHSTFKGYQNYGKLKEFTHRMKTMLLTEPKLTINNLKSIECPALFMAGDHDIIKLNHTNQMFENVKRGYMSIIPGTKHYPQKEEAAQVNTIILDFLNKKFVNLNRF